MKEGSILVKGDFSLLLRSGVDLDGINKHAVKKTVTVQMEEPLIEDRLVNEGNLEEEFKRLEIAEEDRVIGYISWKLYWHYMRAGMRCILAVAVITLFLIVQGSLILPDWWLLHLTSRSHDQQHQLEDLYIYGGLVGGAVLLSIIRAAVFLNALINSSNRLHNSMLSSILKAPVLFFDTNPVGRILNRFSRDIGIVDELLPDVFLDAVQMVLFCVGAVVFSVYPEPLDYPASHPAHDHICFDWAILPEDIT
ncbi:hypothetical protein OS493_023054 [Desmophyllum pertusum]|uniref:ABC transmembrane type-1 domain-containing protein n=1 Tax=Desmophyllum pertusum TaxID=174260 RepID=A0A9W9YZS7_9CNID|nr:hypothetical protein OS493_023054 [Desmophyllum pertusum]